MLVTRRAVPARRSVRSSVRRLLASRRRRDRGVVAVTTAILLTVLVGCCGAVVDVGRWYLTQQQAQRAADAAASGGVVSLPGDPTAAYATAAALASSNGFPSAGGTTVTSQAVGPGGNRLSVTVRTSVNNFFLPLFGIGRTNIATTATADYVKPVQMGSPCNEFGNDPSGSAVRSSNCNATGQFWANIGSPAGTKVSGDAFTDNSCSSSTSDGCPGNVNTDFNSSGYYFTLTLTKPVTDLRVEAFDPAFVAVGDTCTLNGINANNDTKASPPASGTIYASGSSNPACTGDVSFNGVPVTTQYTLRQATSTTVALDPSTYAPMANCSTTFPGYNGDLSGIQDPAWGNGDKVKSAVRAEFRQWVPLCQPLGTTPAGTYYLQVQTSGVGADNAGGHNRFSLRAYSGTDTSAQDGISISVSQRMAIYANIPASKTTFYLARVPAASAGRTLSIALFDIGDSTGPGVVSILDPTGGSPKGCTGTGPVSGKLPSCAVTSSSSFNGRWERISVPIPATYTCDDTDPLACWYRLSYDYGTGNQPSDTTSWTASVGGSPVRLIQ
ncbi:pilus assembly protein TadG-related protein [Lapillicoccus jejuensis]|uniref:Putative Flp pilus-assembly TadE/G-like protein n=1 Tax=Lapillicoccus jejuensis TaxID=402171 RepID=A0A542E2M4_9MICO|nr:pilus assembly protein TadG-related protein [Lapillicoccus jejuensis]TQJ09539.1 putative Flp pilus-assembly TadE/G-like protein [Lapillicoccus jejuensis]